MDTNKKLKLLRELMEKSKIDVYIVNTSDPHGSEYIPKRYETRRWLTGFTGSQGLALVTKDKALLWTDGRYFIQAEEEIKDSEFKLMTMGLKDSIDYEDWIKDSLKSDITIGFNGESFSEGEFRLLEKKLSNETKYIWDIDLIDKIWKDRPEKPESPVFILEEKYAGKSFKDKLIQVRDMMEKDDVDYTFISSLDDIAWLFNLRAKDIDYNPVLFSHSIISKEKAYLFVDSKKQDEDVKNYLKENKIIQREYEDIYEYLNKLEEDTSIFIEKDKVNHKAYKNINSKNIKDGVNYTTKLKAIKNPVELENQKLAYIKDGVALVKFLHWLEKNINKREITELEAAKQLLNFRKEDELFIEPSFETISAYGKNAAMMHYNPELGENAVLKAKGLYLIDSGGQYPLGTTDITRTIGLGPLTDEEIRDCTLTFKAHTMLLDMKFLYGATGHSLDSICRYHMWQNLLDYKCGTGHGIGYMLNVHEGPHRIAPVFNQIVLEENMITSIEPGVYKEGKHGIRLENIVAVREYTENSSGKFMEFEVLSFVPIDLKTIDINLLDNYELKWLNNYHSEVYKKLSPYLEEDVKMWLKENTKKLRR